MTDHIFSTQSSKTSADSMQSVHLAADRLQMSNSSPKQMSGL